MILRYRIVKGHKYWSIVTSKRIVNKPREQTLLYLGRLDALSSDELQIMIEKVRALGDNALIHEFEAVLIRHGYPATSSSLTDYELKAVYSYGQEYVLVQIAKKLNLISLIDKESPKGGGPSLGKMTIALAIYAAIRPGSVYRFVEWYRRGALSWLLELPVDEVTYDAALNTLDYLQPERTRKWERELYEIINREYKYRAERIDIDSTVVELEGTLCRMIAKFGRSKNGTGVGKRRQILITYMIDQEGILLGHEVFPGNRNDAKSLKRINRRLLEVYNQSEVPRVVDRGYASLKNIRVWKRRKEHFLAAVKSKVKSLDLLDKLGPRSEWEEIEEGWYVSSIIRGGIKWVVTWKDEVAKRNEEGREERIKKARKKLEELMNRIEKGRIKSRTERDRKIGEIVKRYEVRRYLEVKGRKGIRFRVNEKSDKEEEIESMDGYQVYATTEVWMKDREIVKAYRERDRIEKAIRTLKTSLGLGPVYLTRREHVLGHVYVHALAYQLRAVMGLGMKGEGMEMSVEEALWELERLEVAELVVKGKEVEVNRKIVEMDATINTIIHIFSLDENGKLPGIDLGI